MKRINLFAFLFLISIEVMPQSNFSVQAYNQFLQSHQNLSTQALMQMHNAGYFLGNVNYNLSDIQYLDSIQAKYNLTPYERTLLEQHGFMVSQRLWSESFGASLLDVYHKDLPVFISVDAILHAWHKSYDYILRDIEQDCLLDTLKKLLSSMHSKMSQLNARYASNPAMLTMLKDVDVYLTVPLRLLNDNWTPYYTANAAAVNDIMTKIAALQMDPVTLFSSTCRTYDFSQLKPRGHYADNPDLQKYFKAMMWLGRTELQMLKHANEDPYCGQQTAADIQRQTIDAFLVRELMTLSGYYSSYSYIDHIIRLFVGEQDNVTYDNLGYLVQAVNMTNASDLLNQVKLAQLQDTLKKQSFAYQKILSQILAQQAMSPDSIVPPAAFMLFGQRFVLDSYVTGQVVYDRIKYQGMYIKRMLPSTLDVLFAMGNDATAQLLQSQLDQYHYGSNLAALRYLINSYDPQFWDASIFNLWLNSIRKLNPPADRTALPPFMRTGAYWQKTINSQLMSWSELRHDNLLYAKQSYSGFPICSYPRSYIEPIPEFYLAMKQLAAQSSALMAQLSLTPWMQYSIFPYLANFKAVMDTLATISTKELNGQTLTSAELNFLRTIISTNTGTGCGEPPYDGWYPGLYYNDFAGADMMKKDYLTADIHTAPADESGIPVGWVMHAGTGRINLGVFIAEAPGTQKTAYIGPAGSYYEIVTQNFLRLTDAEWNSTYLFQAARPSFVNVYLADSNGNSRGIGANLLTGTNDQPITGDKQFVILENYPNPFNSSTLINVTIPAEYAKQTAALIIYDITGAVVKRLFNDEIAEGSFVFLWDGTNDMNKAVSSGVYLCRLNIGAYSIARKMTLMK